MPQTVAPAPKAAAEPIASVDQQKLAALAKPAEPISSAPAVESPARKVSDLEKAEEKLASLVKKPNE